MKRILILLLSLLLCLSLFAGCKKDEEEIPRGFILATCEGEPFRFYLPSTWNSNVAYGISGGYYNLATTSVVRLSSYTREGDQTADAFYESTLRPSFSLFSDLTDAETPADTLLGPLSARRYHVTGRSGDTLYHNLLIVGTSVETFYVLSFLAEDSLYTSLLSDVESMREVFLLSTPYKGDGKTTRRPSEKVDASAGTKLASTDDVAYRFFVPTDWEIDQTISIAEAHSKDGEAILSVTPYLPADSMTVAVFLQTQNGQLITAYGEDYTALESTDGTLGGRAATVAKYRIEEAGTAYLVREHVTAYRGMIYTFTYTAKEAAYEAHLPDADLALASFSFR